MQLRDHAAVLKKGDVFRVDPRALKVMAGFNVRDRDAPGAREQGYAEGARERESREDAAA